jgi:YHS domain-containing protein
MNARIALCAGGLLLCATASVIVVGPEPVAGQTDRGQAYPSQPQARYAQPQTPYAQPQPQPAQPQESETTRQLRLLYAKDGKEMPEMDIRKLPMVQNSPGFHNLRPADPNKKSSTPVGFLKRLFSIGRDSSPSPTYRPPQYRQPAPRYYPTQRPVVPQPAAAPARPVPSPGYAPQQRSYTTQPRTGIPAANVSATRTVPLQKKSANDDIPVLIDERKEPQSQSSATAPPPVSTPAATPRPATNPFPNVPSAADDRPALPSPGSSTAGQKPNEPGPFTGRSLTDDADSAGTKPVAPTPADTGAKFPAGTVTSKPAAPLQIKSFQEIQKNHLQQPHPLAEPKALGGRGWTAKAIAPNRPATASSREEKQRRIAERRSLAGFRGFCPVVLRDQRELADAMLQFRSEYRNKTYYFSTPEAKATFDQSPGKYAPASSGIDVVVFADELKQVEGSLEHASWFRGKLYFFTSVDTLRKFVMDPKKYAIGE